MSLLYSHTAYCYTSSLCMHGTQTQKDVHQNQQGDHGMDISAHAFLVRICSFVMNMCLVTRRHQYHICMQRCYHRILSLAVISEDDARLVVVANDDSCFSLLLSRSRRLCLNILHKGVIQEYVSHTVPATGHFTSHWDAQNTPTVESKGKMLRWICTRGRQILAIL